MSNHALASDLRKTCCVQLEDTIDSLHGFRDLLLAKEVQKAEEVLPISLDQIELLMEAVESLQQIHFCRSVDLGSFSVKLQSLFSLLEGEKYSEAAQFLEDTVIPELNDWNSVIETRGTCAVIFSKDRAMQLDAVIRSLKHFCTDYAEIEVNVLYKAGDPIHAAQYKQLQEDHKEVIFIEENNFREDLIQTLEEYQHVLFLVDDTLFTGSFSANQCLQYLESHETALGYSLRLGANTTYCYTMNKSQSLPLWRPVDDEGRVMIFEWQNGELDFGYPLEVSSSIFRIKDVLPYIKQLQFHNPNLFESALDVHKQYFADMRPSLLCNRTSIAFSNPVNVVQNTFENRAGTVYSYTVAQLTDLFSAGFRINVEAYANFKTHACHQEAEYVFYDGMDARGELHRLAPELPQEAYFAAWFRDQGDKTHRLNYDELTDQSVVFDLGGYEGQWASDIFAKYQSNVYVLEPVQTFYTQMMNRFKKNNKIKVFCCGLSNETKQETLFISNDASSSYKQAGVPTTIQLLEAASFLDQMTSQGIDLMKINIEGGEYDLLDHLIETGWIKKIKNIQVQFHHFIPNAETRMLAIEEKLAQTHVLTYHYRFVWENWKLKEN